MSKVIKIGGRYYRPTTRSYAVAASGTDPLADLRKTLIDTLGEKAADELLGKVTVKPKTLFRRKSVPTARADGDGGTCPYFGVPQHWIKVGQDSTNDDVVNGRCGFRRDGRYAKPKGYQDHLDNVNIAGSTGRKLTK